MRKSQSSIEFVILISFLLFFFALFFLEIQSNMSGKIKERETLLIKQTALAVQDEIELAFKASEGYHRQFELPDKISGKDYIINLSEGMVQIKTVDGKNSMAFPVSNTTGYILKGKNSITKENGEIKINL